MDQNVFVDYDCSIIIGDTISTFEGKFKDIEEDASKAGGAISGTGQIPGAIVKGSTPALDASNRYWESVIKDANGNISAIQQTATSISTSVKNAIGDLSIIQQTASSISSNVSNARSDLSTIKQTATTISTSVTNARSDLSRIEQTATKISSSVTDFVEGYSSTITQTANRIALIVNANGIRPAEIVASINKSGSSVKISANKVDIDGLVTFSDLETNSKTVINGDYITTGKIDASLINTDKLISGILKVDRIRCDTYIYFGKSIDTNTSRIRKQNHLIQPCRR